MGAIKICLKYSAAQTVAEWLELLTLDYHRLLTFITKEFGCKCQLIKEQNASLFSSVLVTAFLSLSLVHLKNGANLILVRYALACTWADFVKDIGGL